MANQLEQVLKKTKAVYKQAAEELAKKLADFQARYAEQDKLKRAAVAAGEITQEEYQKWLSGQVFQGKIWQAKAKEAAETLVRADKEAAAIVNDGCMTTYAAAMNYGTYALEKATGLSTGFTLYNRETVSRLLAKDPQLLPLWKIDQPKDYVWNYKKVQNALLEGIIQGKKIPDIQQDFIGKLLTKDLPEKVQKQMENRMRTFARTGMTGAHNAGRIDALHRAEDKGIKVLKKWLATNDERTRDSHADLDGQIREIDEPFTTTNRDGTTAEINYPGDPTADAEQVYNCRCTMIYIYPEIEDTPEDTEPAPEYEQMTFDQWVEAKENQEAVQGETDPETVTAEDAREPEPEIIAEAAELEQTEPEPEIVPEETLEAIETGPDPLDGLSERTVEAIEDYTMGEELHLEQPQFEEIKGAMKTTEKPMYRVETRHRTAADNDMGVGDRFEFSQRVYESKDEDAGALRSFTRSEDVLPDLVGQVDDPIVYRTVGPVDQLPVDSVSGYDQVESLSFANGWEVTGYDTIVIDGKEYQVIEIRQVEHFAEQAPEPAPETVPQAVDRYHKELEEIKSEREQLETEYSDLSLKSLTTYGTDEYEEVERRMAEVQSQVTKAYEKEEGKRKELDTFLADSGEKEIREALGEIEGKHSMRDDAGAVNTITEDKVTRNNCGYCSLAFDARRRGIDCSAPEMFGTTDAQQGKWWKGFRFSTATSYNPMDAAKEIAAAAEQWGKGARGIVSVDYSKTTGHSFAFEVDSHGRCRFIDPQTGAMDVLVNFENALPGTVRFGRTDDKELTKNAMLFLKKGPAR